MPIPLEDNFTDIIGKAQRGLKLSDEELAEQSGASVEAIQQLHDGQFDRATSDLIAPVLQLDPAALAASAESNWLPYDSAVEGLAQFTTTYHDMKVNSYLVWDPVCKMAIAFDTGADCSEMLERSRREDLVIKLILLTHAHPDHIADLDRLAEATGASVFVSELESAPKAQPMGDGALFEVGGLTVEGLVTSGHSPGGMSFFIRGLDQPVAIVGDSLFAGSMGGGNVSYEDALRNNLEKLMILPNDTILCPGHGPLTTVAEEREHNPFFAGRLES
jgi:hydroxyacylglutathione hydrolase